MTAAQIAHALPKCRKSGKGWVVCCPAHEDRNPSLSIGAGDDGRPLVRCHAGCRQNDVVEALKGLGLWPEPASAGILQIERRIVATYDYTDETGTLRYQVCRTQPKDFFQRIPDGRGGWLNRGPKDEEKILFNLPAVFESPIIFCVEGEKDVLKLAEYGFVGCTNCGGAKARWLPQYTKALRGREVILIPDNDQPGRQRAATIARALLGHVAKLIALELDDDCKDITEWFEKGHSEVELIACLEEVAHAS